LQKASTKAKLRSLIRELARNLECGDSVEIKLDTLDLLSLVPVYSIRNGLSVIDAREEGRGAVVVIENRFGKKCKEREAQR